MAEFIEFPIFDGVSGDVRPWISWLEDFFVRERFTAEEKMNMAQSLLEGEAYAWFSRQQKILIFQSWKDLKDNLRLMFGDFADFDRIQLKTTAILAKDSIQEANSDPVMDAGASVEKAESQVTTLVKVEGNTTMFQILDSWEEDSITPNQVPVSKLEHSLQIPKESSNVCETSLAVVGCEHQRSIQKNIRMDVVNGDVERIQRVLSISKNVSAHQVLDKMCLLKRLKPKNKRKLSLSLKTWKFKFKNKMLQRNRSQMDLQQVIDISKVNNLYPCFCANFGLVRKKRTFQCLRLKKQAHKSSVLYQLWHRWKNKEPLILWLLLSVTNKVLAANHESPAVFAQHLVTLGKLEGKPVFNGGSNGKAATGMRNERLTLHHSFTVCPWLGPGVEIQKATKTMTVKLLSQQSLMIEHNSVHLSLLLLECNPGEFEGLTSFVKILMQGHIACYWTGLRMEIHYYEVKYSHEIHGVDLERALSPQLEHKWGIVSERKPFVVLLLHLVGNHDWVTNSWQRKLCKNWWFKFKIMVIWLEVVSCLFSEGYVSGVCLVCSATGWTTASDAGHCQQAMYGQNLMVNEQLLQPILIIQQVMRNENIKFSKRCWFKSNYWFGTREKIHRTGKDVAAIISKRFFLHRQKQRKSLKTWMFKYKSAPKQKQLRKKQQYSQWSFCVCYKCRDYERSWAHKHLVELQQLWDQLDLVLVVLSSLCRALSIM